MCATSTPLYCSALLCGYTPSVVRRLRRRGQLVACFPPPSVLVRGCPCPASRRRWPAKPGGRQRSHQGVSRAQDGRSERPATGTGQPETPQDSSVHPRYQRARKSLRRLTPNSPQGPRAPNEHGSSPSPPAHQALPLPPGRPVPLRRQAEPLAAARPTAAPPPPAPAAIPHGFAPAPRASNPRPARHRP